MYGVCSPEQQNITSVKSALKQLVYTVEVGSVLFTSIGEMDK